MLHSTHCIHQLLPTLKFMPMKLHTSHCAFALLYCHYNLYKHSFVLRCIFDGALIACVVAWPAIHCYSFFMYFLFYFNNFFAFLGTALLQLHTNFSLILMYRCYSYCVSFCALLDGDCLSGNKRITYLLTYLHIRYFSNKRLTLFSLVARLAKILRAKC